MGFTLSPLPYTHFDQNQELGHFGKLTPPQRGQIPEMPIAACFGAEKFSPENFFQQHFLAENVQRFQAQLSCIIACHRASSCVIVRHRSGALFLGGNWGVSQPITLHLPQLVSSVTHDNNTTGFNRDDPIFRVFSAGDRFFSRPSRVFFV